MPWRDFLLLFQVCFQISIWHVFECEAIVVGVVEHVEYARVMGGAAADILRTPVGVVCAANPCRKRSLVDEGISILCHQEVKLDYAGIVLKQICQLVFHA